MIPFPGRQVFLRKEDFAALRGGVYFSIEEFDPGSD